MSAPKTIWAFHDGPMVGLFIGKKEVGSNIAEYTLTDPTTITLDRAKYEALVKAFRDLFHATCGPTGFAAAVRHNSGIAYPWPSLDKAEAQAEAALKAVQP